MSFEEISFTIFILTTHKKNWIYIKSVYTKYKKQSDKWTFRMINLYILIGKLFLTQTKF